MMHPIPQSDTDSLTRATRTAVHFWRNFSSNRHLHLVTLVRPGPVLPQQAIVRHTVRAVRRGNRVLQVKSRWECGQAPPLPARQAPAPATPEHRPAPQTRQARQPEVKPRQQGAARMAARSAPRCGAGGGGGHKKAPREGKHPSRGAKSAATYSPALRGSTIGACGLNFSVRDGKRWGPAAMAALMGDIPHMQAQRDTAAMP